ncbi:hypothetical protein M892_04945 [Vibrio campbellii ATCC BAA-1116]|nr:hypothetical protein M892_04945 [Vibrio campbellii ATCC BAA-1116]
MSASKKRVKVVIAEIRMRGRIQHIRCLDSQLNTLLSQIKQETDFKKMRVYTLH